MSELNVRIVKLDPMRVAVSHGFGEGPESIAWDKIKAYVLKTGLLNDGQPHRFFGFNNPDPAPGSPNYGYEQWVTVGPDAQPDADIRMKEFDGGLYAVTRTSLAEITQTWHSLIAWRERSPYKYAGHQWLEEALNWNPDQTVDAMGPENVMLDLYMPVAG